MDALSQEWLNHQTAERTPPNTIARRRSVLASVGHAGTATREDIETWWASRRHLSPATRANDLACLRAFYKWCARWDHRDPRDDPTLRIDPPKVDRGLPQWVSKADLHRLLDTLPPDLTRAVALGAYAGLRVAEAATLHWDDVDTSTMHIRVTGTKGAKSRLIKISPILLDELLPDTGGNVVTGAPGAMSPAQLQRRVNRALAGAGVDGTFHQLRHRYGTLAYQATRDLVAVGRQMGHASPVTTAIYAAASDEMADRIAEAVTR